MTADSTVTASTPGLPDADAGRATVARLADLAARLDGAAPTIGFPAACDLDWQPLADIFTSGLVNNLGDPYVDGLFPRHVKDVERDAIGMLADLFRADDAWGYIAGGAAEATLYGLELARRLHPGAVVYHSAAAHPAVVKAVRLLAMPSVVLRTDEHGELDYPDLAGQVEQRRDRPVVVVANAGTSFAEAVDDVCAIVDVLDDAAVPAGRRFILVDAALSGIPLALLDPDSRPGFDFADGADCVIVSGHKFLATPMCCAAVIVNASLRGQAPAATYTGSPDATIAFSRNGHAAVAVWWALTTLGRDGLAARAAHSRQVAADLHHRLSALAWPAWRHPHAMTVTLTAPPAPIRTRFRLAEAGGRSHIVCVPGVNHDHLDALITAIAETVSAPAGPGNPDGTEAAGPNGRRGWLPRPRRRPADPAGGVDG